MTDLSEIQRHLSLFDDVIGYKKQTLEELIQELNEAPKPEKEIKNRRNRLFLDRIYQHFSLKAVKKPRSSSLLAGTMGVLDEFGRGYCNLYFSDTFLTALGKVMPMGLSSVYPAFLRAVRFPNWGVWRIYCSYFDQDLGFLVYEDESFPAWAGKIYRPESEDGRRNRLAAPEKPSIEEVWAGIQRHRLKY